MKLAILLLAILPLLTRAACPNACSGHGSCGEFDMCTCYTNFEGGDCSQRVCPFNWAWVTTSNGDINFDGDRYDGTEYNVDYPFSQGDSNAQLTTQRSPGGTWENWPYFGHANEGHFYMECSNRGLCDRSTGDCACFPGYSGTACRRSVCPNDCSGHGTCETIAEMAQFPGLTYALWDRSMQRTCLCDPGYTGPSCEERLCPYGDDPLTVLNNYNEVQYVEVKANSAFAGTMAFKYTDYYGEEWKSDYFTVAPAASNAVDTDAQDVLLGIPNDVFEGISVKRQYCEQVIPGVFATDGSGALVTATSTGAAAAFVLTTGDVIRCPAASTSLFTMTSATAFTVDDASTESTADDTTCFLVDKECALFRIDFSNTAGDLIQVDAVTDKITVGGKTNAQDGSTGITQSGNDYYSPAVQHATGGVIAQHTKASTVTDTCDGTVDTMTIATNTITCSANTDWTVFGLSEKVAVECYVNSAWKALGTYTVHGSTDPTTGVLTTVETFPSCTAKIRVTLVSEFITVNADVGQIMEVGDHVTVNGWNAASVMIAESFLYSSTTGNTKVFLSLAKESAASGSETDTTGTEAFKIENAGTSESNECSDRGLCNRESGICACFKGYTGDSCHVQNNLAA